MARSNLTLLLGLLLSLSGTAFATSDNCTTAYLMLDIDIEVPPDYVNSCNSTEAVALQGLLSRIVNKRFRMYGNETPEVVSSIEIDGVCQTASSNRRALMGTNGWVWNGGPKCRFCPPDNKDNFTPGLPTVPLPGFNGSDIVAPPVFTPGLDRKRMLRRRNRLTVADQVEKLVTRLERQLGRILTRKVNHNEKSCLLDSESMVLVNITAMEEAPDITCI